MMAVLRRLARLGIDSCRRMVRTTNEPAIRFYLGLGFERGRKISNYYGFQSDAWRMARCVTATHPRPPAPQAAGGKRR